MYLQQQCQGSCLCNALENSIKYLKKLLSHECGVSGSRNQHYERRNLASAVATIRKPL